MYVFRFQLFDVIQSNNPLKVGTDSMLLGAFIDPTDAKTALDIGAGTGVLSLMVLQKNPKIELDAVEIHSDAADECSLNFANSPWGNVAKVHAQDFLEFHPAKKYDLIFSNPPFYLDGLKSGDKDLDQAKHISREMYEKFICKTSELLHEDGRFYVIVPYTQFDYLSHVAQENRLFLHQRITIHATKEKLNSRVVLMFCKKKGECLESEFTIRLSTGGYTPEYIALTKDYHSTDLTAKN
jgi:tRNA1Val (adenine37-N6)-methyltransferase